MDEKRPMHYKNRKPELRKLFDRRPGVKLINVYGPTACACICSAYDVSAADFVDLQGLPPLGAMAKNFSALLLDEEDRPAAPGEIGELCLLGPRVGLGYCADPERTAQAFVVSPHNRAWDERMYRTGDLARLDPDGVRYWFVGRKENQIKYMGYRIELEEIEAALNALPGVIQSAVVHQKSARRGSGVIVAHVAADPPPAEAEIRQGLRAVLPEYMTPHRVVFHPRLPKNANGKVDRQALAAE